MVRLNKRNSYFSKKLNRTPSQISQALNSNLQPGTLARIVKHLDYLEQKEKSKCLKAS